MEPRKPLSWKESLRFTMLMLSVVGIHVLMRLLHGQPGELPVAATHLFSIPIIIAAVWWANRIAFVAAVTAAAILFAHLLPPDRFTSREVWFETAMFVAVAAVTVMLVGKLRRFLDALRDREHRLRSVFDRTEDVVFIKDRQLKYVEVNPAMLRKIGRSREQVIGRTAAELFGAQEGGRIEAADREALAGKSSRQEYILPFPGGQCHMDVIKGPLRDNDGNVTGLFGIARDITERKLAEFALMESEENFRALAENADDSMIILNARGDFLYANRRMAELTGYGVRDLCAMNHRQIVPPDEYATMCDRLERRLRGEDLPQQFETSIVRRDRAQVSVELTGARTTWKGAPAGLVIVRDVTARKHAERILQEERDRAQMYLDVAGVMIVALDVEGNVTLINRRGCRILGYPENEILGQNWFDRFIPEGQRGMVRKTFAALVSGQLSSFEYFENAVLARDGSIRILSWHNTLLRRPEGHIVGTLASGTDITERKRAEEELRQSHDYLNSIVNGMHEGLMVVDRGLIVRDANQSLAARHGLTREDLIGRHCHEVIYGQSSPCPGAARLCPTRTVFKTGVPVRNERTHPLPDGREIIVDTYTFPLFDAAGDVELAVQIQDEVTERVRAERIRQHSEKLAATGRMAARIAHEINNPLAGIKYSFLLIKDAVPVDHPYHGYVARIESEIERIARIVRNMYDLYTPEQEKPTRFALDDAINDVVALLAPRCREKEIALNVNMPPNPIRVRLPKGSVFQVLFNIIQNAIDASSSHGEVALTVEPRRGFVRVSVADRGPGIPEELHAHIFEPFFTTKRNQDGVGLGLGLPVSRSLVDAMGGTLDFETEPGKGTVFYIGLPAIDPEQETRNER